MLFVVILKLLVRRMRAGADSGQRRAATPVPRGPPPATQSQPPSQSRAPNADPNDPFGQQQVDPNVDPGSNGTTDNFGNAVPDGSGGTLDDDRQARTSRDPRRRPLRLDRRRRPRHPRVRDARRSRARAPRRIRAVIEDAEAGLSRFRPDSELSALNRDRRTAVPASPLLLHLALAVRSPGARSGGVVDATLLAPLE